jgi:DNA-binding LacI/PurR family transcriptional regulator/signal transduction histidine kinase/ActR/RegA family two-component response regulator
VKSASTGRRTIAVLIDQMDLFIGGYETGVRRTFDAVCRDQDVNLLFVYGRTLAGPPEWCAGHNAVYELLCPDRVDGMVIFSAVLAHFVGTKGLVAWCDRYRSMPLCSVGIAVPGVPSLIIDNRVGMEAVVEHVVRDHGCRRVVFIGGSPGNPEAQLRFEAYRTVLERQGLALDPELVTCGDFASDVGRSAMDELLRRGVKPDAVVAANDGMAIGAMEALRGHRLRVPRDVAVTGFDDLALARLASTPLTTVAQPFRQVAESAIGLVLRQLDGLEVDFCTTLPTEIMVRQSCGCGRRSRRGEPARRTGAARPSAEPAGDSRQSLERLFASPPWSDLSLPSLERLPWLDAVESELGGQPGAFLALLDDVLQEIGDDPVLVRNLLSAVTRLEDECQESSSGTVDGPWSEARSLVLRTMARCEAQQRFETAEAFMRIAKAGDYCSRAVDLPSLESALAWALTSLRIDTVFVGRFAQPGSDGLDPVIWRVDGLPRALPAARVPARSLYPSGTELDHRRHVCLVFPLAFETELLGLVVFEHKPEIEGYQMFRDEIAAALRAVNLMREVVTRTAQHERSVQERIATAKRMEALRVLAGGVAHDLNNALGPLVALPDVVLRELGGAECRKPDRTAEMRKDLETIRAASLRAADTIKDLLALSRQGRTTKDLLDLNRAVGRCLLSERLGITRDGSREVDVRLDLNEESLFVVASESHLVRAVTNLVRNAIEAIEERGEVVVKTDRASVGQPLVGYETIEPGDYACLTVSDDGGGIGADDLGRVFEPFFSRKRIEEHSGSGLGLAIVHGVVKEHGGFVDVRSVLGEGTTFALYFPIATQAPRSRAPSSVPPCGVGRILIVDDEASQLHTGRRVLTQLGYEVDTLSSGKQALELHAEAAAANGGSVSSAATGRGPYDVVILDMLLNEECDGLLVSERIRQLFPAQRVIIASGHAPPERVELALGEDLTWLAKPYTADALARTVWRARRGV